MEKIVVWEIIGQFFITANSCFVCPASSNIADCVTTTAEDKHGQAKRPDEIDALSMALESEIEWTKPISAQRISSTLHNNNCGSVDINSFSNNLMSEMEFDREGDGIR